MKIVVTITDSITVHTDKIDTGKRTIEVPVPEYLGALITQARVELSKNLPNERQTLTLTLVNNDGTSLQV